MKKSLLIFLCCGAMAAHAQAGREIAFTARVADNYNNDAQHSTVRNEFDKVNIIVGDKKIKLYNIPENKKHVWGVVTNMEGEWIKTANLSAEKNVIDIHKLHRHIYFLTLMYKDKGKKAFVIRP